MDHTTESVIQKFRYYGLQLFLLKIQNLKTV